MNADRHQSAQRRKAWPLLLGVVWLVGFTLFFYSLTPPNNPSYSRFEFWQYVPFVLLDTVDPPEEAAADRSGWVYLPQRLDLMAVAAVILAGAWGAGHLLLRLIDPPAEKGGAERTVYAFALGLAGLSLLTLGCGLAGQLRLWLLSGLTVAPLIVECGLRLKGRLSARRASPAGQTRRSPSHSDPHGDGGSEFAIFRGLCLAAAAPFLLAMLLGAMLPSTDFDVKEYHLQGPKEFYLNGRIGFLPHNVYTSFPFHSEMLSLLAMVLRGDWFRGALAGKAVLMCFGPLTAVALYAAGRRWFSPAAGWLAAVVYLTTPWIFRISTIAYAEGALTFYLLASLLAVAGPLRELRTGNVPYRQLLLSGLLAGSAVACKYTGAVQVVLPLLGAVAAAPLLGRTSNPRGAALRSAGVFLLGAAITVGPWLAKNVVETGNPVYPLLYTVFGGRDWSPELNEKWRAAHSPPNYSDLPERLLEVTAGNDWLSPLLFGLAPLSLLAVLEHRGRHSRPEARASGSPVGVVGWLWIYGLWLFAAWWAFTHRIDRFWVPMLPVVALLAGVGASLLNRRPWWYVAGVVIACSWLYGMAMIAIGDAGYNAFLIDLKVARERVAPAGIGYLNHSLPRNSAVLMVGEAQVFDARFPLAYHTVFDESIFEQWFGAGGRNVPSADRPLRRPRDIRRTLHEQGMTHVFVNWQEVLRYRTTYGYTDFVAPRRFQTLQAAGVIEREISLGVLVDRPLWQQLQNRGARWEPVKLTMEEGRDVIVYNVRPGLDPRNRREIEAWGPSLVQNAKGRKLLVTGAVYRAVPPAGSAGN